MSKNRTKAQLHTSDFTEITQLLIAIYLIVLMKKYTETKFIYSKIVYMYPDILLNKFTRMQIQCGSIFTHK